MKDIHCIVTNYIMIKLNIVLIAQEDNS